MQKLYEISLAILGEKIDFQVKLLPPSEIYKKNSNCIQLINMPTREIQELHSIDKSIRAG